MSSSSILIRLTFLCWATCTGGDYQPKPSKNSSTIFRKGLLSLGFFFHLAARGIATASRLGKINESVRYRRRGFVKFPVQPVESVVFRRGFLSRPNY